MKSNTVLISGRSKAACEPVRQLLENLPDIDASLSVRDNGHADPLHGQRRLPDILILVLDSGGDEMLRALSARAASERPPTIVIGPVDDPALMRRAMQAGARDYFTPPLQQAELLESVRSIGRERGVEPSALPRGTLIAVINAKGGSGASTVAANLAHIRALSAHSDVGLIDLDLQFGALPLAFDLAPHKSLVELIGSVDQLSPGGLRDQAARHASGVAVFSAMSEQMPLPWELPAQSLTRLLDIARQAYGNVFVDLPRQIDPLTTTVLEQADHVVIVMQQSLAHVRDAKRLLRVLTSSLAVPSTNIVVVVNRYSENTGLKEQEIIDAVTPPRSMLLPNDYKTVSEAQNIGVPLQELDKGAPITRALGELLDRLTRSDAEAPPPPPKKRGLRAVLGALRT